MNPGSAAVSAAPDAASAVDAAFDAVASDTSAPVEETTEQADQSAEDAPEAEAPAEAEPPAEEPAAEEPPAPPEPEPQDELEDPEIKPDHITERGGKKFYHYTEKNAHRLLAASDFKAAVMNVVPNATPEGIGHYYEKAVEYQKMMADFDIGGPEEVTSWTNYMFGQEANPESVAIVAQNLASPAFAQMHPKAYGVLRGNLLNAEIQRLYRAGMQQGQDAAFALAQNLDHAINGRFLEREDLAKQSDPYAIERQRFERERADFNRQKQESASQRLREWMEATDEAVSSGEEEEITGGLKFATDKGAYNPEQIEFMKFTLRKAIEDAKKTRPAFMREFETAKQQARANPSGESRNRVVSMWRQFVQPIIAQHRKGVIAKVTGNVVSANAAAHQNQQQMARRVEPNATPAPAQRQTRIEKIRSAKSYDDAMDAFLA